MSNHLDLTGASACHSMVAGISALKTIKTPPGVVLRDADDDGTRRDYANADRLVGEALDLHANNPGFRRALANFLLMVYASDVPDMAKWAPQAMLTDDGYRGPAPQQGATATRQSFDPNAFDFEDTGHRVDGLLRLAHWVERARGLSEALDGAAQCDPDLKARLQSHGIAYADCWWEDEEQNGMLQLIRLAYRDVAGMTKAGMAVARGRHE